MTQKYKRTHNGKDIVVEAFKWTSDQYQTDDPEWIINAIEDGRVTFRRYGAAWPIIVMVIEYPDNSVGYAFVNDYIVRYENGMIVPVSTVTFEHHFREVNDNGQ
jgi:hypothetical protein